MAGVWVLSEQPATLLELTGGGRQIADALGVPLTALVFGSQETATEVLAHGAEGAIILRLPEGQPPESAAATVADLARQADPDVILIGGSLRGKDLAARLAAALDAPLFTDAVNLRVEDRRLVVDRYVYGGSGIVTQAALSRPQMATIAPHTFPAPAKDPRLGDVREVDVRVDGRVRVVERRPPAGQAVDLAGARVVVGMGRGLTEPSDLQMIETLAQTLGGAVGCTRPVAEDLGLLPPNRNIGISGRRIAPDVYVAVALSGQVQHMVGVRDAKLVVAINTDENAPVFAAADYGLVGDARQVVPALTEELKRILT